MGLRVSRLTHERRCYLVLSVPLGRPRSFADLTAAEISVADGILSGKTMRELALLRGVSERTIGSQLARIYRKLGIGSRQELVALISRAASRRGGTSAP